MEKYYNQDVKYNRTARNSNLYKEVYGSYANLENLPIADNTNEIDISDLEKIVSGSSGNISKNQRTQEQELIEIRKKEEQREYDINKILEKVKTRNEKIRENVKRESALGNNFLINLESQKKEISSINTEDANDKNLDDSLSMTRELKFKDKQLEVTREIEAIKEENVADPLDLFQDLKPDGNTFITEPVKQDDGNIFSTLKDDENVNFSIVKNVEKKDLDNSDDDFYTSSYNFSKNDFYDGEDDLLEGEHKGSGIFKIILLLIAIFGLTCAIYYFISRYGIGV